MTKLSLKLGKKPARHGAVQLCLSDYVDMSLLPKPPAEFGHENLIGTAWGMLGNDTWGDCAWAGAAHETMLWTRAAGKPVQFTTENVLADYGACTGFDPSKPDTDQGSDMQEAASYRLKTGIIDAAGCRHKVAAYAAIRTGDIELMLRAAYCFEAVAIGIMMPDSAMDQFNDGKPWSVVPGSKIEGGHYVPIVARRGGHFIVSTWGALQPVEDDFIRQNNDETIVFFSQDMLNGTKTLDGFDAEQLMRDLKLVSKRGVVT